MTKKDVVAWLLRDAPLVDEKGLTYWYPHGSQIARKILNGLAIP